MTPSHPYQPDEIQQIRSAAQEGMEYDDDAQKVMRVMDRRWLATYDLLASRLRAAQDSLAQVTADSGWRPCGLCGTYRPFGEICHRCGFDRSVEPQTDGTYGR